MHHHAWLSNLPSDSQQAKMEERNALRSYPNEYNVGYLVNA